MEVQKLVWMQIFALVVIQLTLLACTGSLAHAFLASSEGGKCNSNSNVKTKSISGLPCLDKYITKSYFNKHDSLIDSNFQNFIANELPMGFCGELQEKLNLAPRLSVLQRYLIGEGSHRRLSSFIRLSVQLESIAELPRHFCNIIIVEKLPSGIIADPFELEHLLQRGVFTDAAVFGDTNLELPSVVSNRSVVEVHMDVGHTVLSGHNNGLEIYLELPLHARYPPLGVSGFSRVEFSRPDLFMHCSIEEKSQDHSCLFVLNGSVTDSETVVWEVPAGIKDHSEVASVVTFISAILSAFLIVFTSIYYPYNRKSAVV